MGSMGGQMKMRERRDKDSNAEVGTRNVEFLCADGQRARQANRLNCANWNWRIADLKTRR